MSNNDLDFSPLLKRLNDIEQNAKELNGEHTLSGAELFTPSFMRKHSNTSTIGDFLSPLGISGNSESELDNIPDEELDSLVRKQSDFSSWDDMKSSAVHDYLEKQLFRRR